MLSLTLGKLQFLSVPGALLLFLTVILSGGGKLLAQETIETLPPSPSDSFSNYELAPGDRIKVDIFNHVELSGEYTLNDEGRFSMPLIGTVEASGLNPLELEDLLVSMLKPDYLVNPRVFIQVMNSRLYYLIGEVAGRGAFPYKSGMNYLTAIANAGGYTYRAKQDFVFVVRGDDPDQNELKLSVEEKVLPGDIIRIDERMF
jgi:protein involved in polysaccharide export with SLBB domain